MSTEQLPDGLQLAVNELLKLAESNRNMGPLDQGSFFDLRALALSASADAIRAEHAQLVTMQHHAAEVGGRRIAELEAANAALLERARTLEGDNQRLEAERDALRSWKAEIEAQEPAAWIERLTGRLASTGDEHRSRFPMVYDPLYARPVPAQAVPVGWRPIAAEPADGGLYWVLIGDQPHVARFSNRTSSAKWWNAYGITRAVAEEPTHWMPIPDAPEHKA